MIQKKAKLDTESYKGVRDFYPPEMFIQNYIFSVWRRVVESYGYEEYGASILEPTELYKAKTSDEIVQEQTYSFTDRGGRDVTLRPEMTPTVARMVAGKRRELTFPLRWYSIPNVFRYEKPQRGRLREHWQLNVDMFGIADMKSELEVISLASALMKSYGAKDEDFEIRVNSRKVMNYILKNVFELDQEGASKVSRLIDRKDKMEAGEFERQAEHLLEEKTESFLHVLNSKDLDVVISALKSNEEEKSGIGEIKEVLLKLEKKGIKNLVFSPALMRGFDYYTGIVFEIFDTNPQNRRALFGGGRYDNLLSLFGEENIPAFGFAMGDVTIRDFLETRNLLPSFSSKTQVAVALIGDENFEKAQEFTESLRKDGVNVLLDSSDKKVGDKIKFADKLKIPYVIVYGEEESKSGQYKVKNLKTGEEVVVELDKIKSVLKA
ncbi:MAG: histidine--tRNA ligase [Candidatus Taylorbacteria bacterium]